MTSRELHVISNGKKTFEELALIVQAIHPFITAFQLREKTKTAYELWKGIQLLVSAGVPLEKLYLNDRVDVAMATGIKGVQLAYHSLEPQVVKKTFPTLRMGRSVHSSDEAIEMEKQGADYLLYGHIFPTHSKPNLPARGLEALENLIQQVNISVIAIGGIQPEHVTPILKTGAHGIAVMSGIIEASNPERAAQQYFEALHEGRDEHV